MRIQYRSREQRLASSMMALGLLVGCPGQSDRDDDSQGDDDTGPSDDDSAGEPCDYWNAWGQFGIQIDDDGGEFYGVFYDDPSPLMLDALIEAGDCTFFGFDPMPHCEPACDPPQVCGPDEQCHDWPAGIDVGTVEVTGTQPPLSLQPGFGNAYYGDQTYLDLVEPGAEITLAASGTGTIGSFELRARGVAPWEIVPDPLVMVRGEELAVRWQPASDPPDAQILVHLRADHHAGSTARITCIADDGVGEVLIDAALVDALIDAGTGGLGTYVESARIMRASADTILTDAGCAMFYVGADVPVDVNVEP
jgi:hypothetical protein